jgi:hypothetical protein
MPFIYMETSPKLSGKARDYGRDYRKMAVVEVEQGYGVDHRPKMISERARGVVRIVESGTVHMGKTMRSAGVRYRSRLLDLCEHLNNSEAKG